MNSFFDTYSKLIFEADEELADLVDDTADEEIEEIDDTEGDAEGDTEENTDLVLVFSTDLIAEFNKTVNEFTDVCAQIAEEQGATKEIKKQFTDLHKKIKDLADAAKV